MASRVMNGRTQEGGRLAVHKQDFNVHVNGGDFRHDATNIDMSPSIPDLGGSTVQETLQNIYSLVTSSGTGFISIGILDGYSDGNGDGYAQGSYNVGSVETPTLYDAFISAFADERLKNGGVILLMAGTYSLSTAVTVPAGITIMGETSGTIVVSETSEQPMFVISAAKKTTTIGGDSGSGQLTLSSGSNVELTRLFNLILTDNLDGYAALGEPTMTTVPMVQVKAKANVVFERVSFIGRIHSGAISGRSKTYAAIATNGTGSATHVTAKECFFDALGVPIIFTPSGNETDFLYIHDCKARAYGTETNVDITALHNSFIVTTMCNISAKNNYFVGAGAYVNTFLNITSGSGANCNVMMIGNHGSAATITSSQLVVNDSGSTFTGVITGNNWGLSTNSPWYVVVGGADNDAPIGDIFGPNAINTILTLAQNAEFTATVIVNPGTYTVTGGGGNYANVKFIGNKIGKKYPVFELDVTDATPNAVGAQFITLGNHIEGIHFTSKDRQYSVMVGWNPSSSIAQTAAHWVRVVDCIFTDVTLYCLDIGAGPFTDSNGVTAKLGIEVSKCDFYQTGTYDVAIDLVLPPAHEITISDSTFRGYGYAASIGNDTYSAAVLNGAMYRVFNVSMITSGIADESPADTSSYFVINDIVADVILSGCTIAVSDTLAAVTNTVTSASAPNFQNFITIHAKTINLDHCTFNGPIQTFTDGGGTEYFMPTVWVEPTNSLKVDGCRFVNGALPLQIGGSNAFSDSNFRQGAYITNNDFVTTDGSVFTLLDIDVDVSGSSGSSVIVVANNLFRPKSGASNVQIRHTEQTSNYVVHGVIQIYAPYFGIEVYGNKVSATSSKPSVNPYTFFTGIVVDNWNSTSGTAGGSASSVHIHDNHVTMTNSVNLQNLQVSCIHAIGSVLNIHNNNMAMSNLVGSVATTFIGCLYIDNRATNSGSYSDAIVTNNIFSRRSNTGVTSTLSVAYVQIDSNSGRGILTDNVFSDSTIDGSSESLIFDATTQPNKWLVERNKNQSKTIAVRGYSGKLFNYGVLGTPGIGVDAETIMINDTDSYTIEIHYLTADGIVNFMWILPLIEVIPIGARIVSVDVSGTSDITLTRGSFSFQIKGNGLTTQNGATSLDFTGAPLTKSSTITIPNSSSTTTFDNTVENDLKVLISAMNLGITGGISASSDGIIKFSSLSIKYRW